MEQNIINLSKVLDAITYPMFISDVSTNKIIYLNKIAKLRVNYNIIGKNQNEEFKKIVNSSKNIIKSITKKYDIDKYIQISVIVDNINSLNIVDNILNKMDFNFKSINKYQYMFESIDSSFEALKSASELYLVYQPKINIKNLSINGYEVLTRWEHKEHGYISPIEFIPFFISTNKIKDFDLFVFENSFKFQEELIKSNIHQNCSINLSIESFKDIEVLRGICTLADKYNIPTDSIIIEILEHEGLEYTKSVLDKFNILKNKGFKISIDDFGIGYSSLSRIYNFEIDELKVAKELLVDINKNKKQRSILKNIFDLANELDIETVVEGVESEDIFNLAKSIGFSNSQGYFHSKPLKKDDYIKFITEKS